MPSIADLHDRNFDGDQNGPVLGCVLDIVLGSWDPIKNEWRSAEIFIKLTGEADLQLVGSGWWAEARQRDKVE